MTTTYMAAEIRGFQPLRIFDRGFRVVDRARSDDHHELLRLPVENVSAQFYRIADCRLYIVGLNAERLAAEFFIDEQIAALQLRKLYHVQAAVDTLFLLLFAKLHTADRIETVRNGLDRFIRATEIFMADFEHLLPLHVVVTDGITLAAPVALERARDCLADLLYRDHGRAALGPERRLFHGTDIFHKEHPHGFAPRRETLRGVAEHPGGHEADAAREDPGGLRPGIRLRRRGGARGPAGRAGEDGPDHPDGPGDESLHPGIQEPELPLRGVG